MSRLSQMLAAELKHRRTSETVIAKKFGWSKQTFNTWKNDGVIPRQQWHVALAEFLEINLDELEMLVDEAEASTGNTKLPRIEPPTLGRVTDRKDGKFHFDAVPDGRYAVRIDTRVMEPALVLGGIAWAQPGAWPQTGHDVIVHIKGGSARIGQFVSFADGVAVLRRHQAPEITVRDVQAVHVIVLSERVAN
jgi:hypothetical protein